MHLGDVLNHRYRIIRKLGRANPYNPNPRESSLSVPADSEHHLAKRIKMAADGKSLTDTDPLDC